jgi:hypothetical protein
MNPEPRRRARQAAPRGGLSLLAVVGSVAQVQQRAEYQPTLAVSETLEPF